MIYGLYNKDTGHVRYVGRTQKTAGERLANHRYTAREKRGDTPKDRWMRDIGTENVDIITLEQECENPEEAELWWMDYMEFLGCELLNVIRCEIGGKVGEDGLEITDEVKSLMGTMPDRELGEKLGVATNTVAKHRNRLEIEAYGNNGGYELPEELIEKLGEVPDGQLAREYEPTKSTIRQHRKKRGIDPAEPFEHNLPEECFDKMGDKPDHVIAEEYDVSSATIARKRRKNNISPYEKSKSELPEECIEKLGKEYDKRLAETYNTYVHHIAEERQKRGISRCIKKSVSKKHAGEIKWLVRNTENFYSEISEIYDTSCATVSEIANDKYYEETVDSVKPE